MVTDRPGGVSARDGEVLPGSFGLTQVLAVDSARGVLLWLAVASLMIMLPDLVTHGAERLAVGMAGAGVLAASWAWGYRRHTVSLGVEVVDAAALFMIGSTAPTPWVASGVAFGALWFRSFYGSGRRVVVRVCLYGFSLVVAAFVASPFGMSWREILPTASTIPLMAVTGVAGWRLAVMLEEHDTVARLVAVRADLGTAMFGEPDERAISASARDAMAEVSAAAPGVRMLVAKVFAERGSVVVCFGDWQTEPVEVEPGTLAQLEPLTGLAAVRAGSCPTLDRAAGEVNRWAAVSRPAAYEGGSEIVLIIGAAPGVSEDVVAATTATVLQVQAALDGAAAHRALAVRASTDELTGLANRGLFFDGLAEARGSGRTTSVLYLDLDGFKAVNDVHGHVIGDEVLCQVAARLRAARREGDLCARLGGDEFAIVLPDTDRATASGIARRLEAIVVEPIDTEVGAVTVGVSWGVATTTHDDDPDPLGQADVAMYAHKQSRRTRPTTTPSRAEIHTGNTTTRRTFRV